MTLMIGALGGLAYAAVLWYVALRVAQTRGLSIGRVPLWGGLMCMVGAAAAAQCLCARDALLAGSTLVGTIVCAHIDARTGLIFDALSRTMLVLAAAECTLTGRLVEGAAGAIVIVSLLAALYFGTSRRGIGLGDVKLGSVIGLGYGIAGACLAVGSAFVLGAVYGVVMLVSGRAKRGDAVRFGPFLAAGAAVALIVGMMGWWT